MMINNGMPNIFHLSYSFHVIKLGCFAAARMAWTFEFILNLFSCARVSATN